MEDKQLLHEFEKCAAAMNITVRYTADSSSGICRIKNEQVLFVNESLDIPLKLDVFKRVFDTLDFESVFLVPAIRRLLGKDEHGDW